MKYQITILLFIAILSIFAAAKPFPKETSVLTIPLSPINPDTASFPRRGRGRVSLFGSDRLRKKYRDFKEKDRFRRKTWERESGSVTSGSRDISSRSASIARGGRRSRI